MVKEFSLNCPVSFHAAATPNVIIAGAPKCGTSSLFNWLSDHPEVCASVVKETCFFMDSDYPQLNKINYHNSSIEQYFSYFKHCNGKNAKVIIEATPHYFYQSTALEILPTLRPVPQIIFILRKPSSRVYSLFQYSKNNLAVLDQGMSFGDFISILKNNNSNILENRVFLRNAVEHSKYVNYISRWIKKAGKENVHVFLFEHLKEDPVKFMKDFSNCIGIDGSFWDRYQFARINPTYQIRSQKIQRLKKTVGDIFPEVIKSGLKRIYYHANIKNVNQPKLNKEDLIILDMLEETVFSEYNSRLAELLSIDLTLWETTPTKKGGLL